MSTFYLSPGQVRHYERRPFTYLGVQYTKHGATRAKFLELGFTEVTIQARPDDRYYYVSGPDNDGVYNATPRDLDQLIEAEVGRTKETAGSLLASSDWLVVRASEIPDKPVPAEITAYRNEVRLVSDLREAEVSECTSVEELSSLVGAPAEVYDPVADAFIPNTEPFLTPWPVHPDDVIPLEGS